MLLDWRVKVPCSTQVDGSSCAEQGSGSRI